MTHHMVLAGALDDLGDGWIGMFGSWANNGLKVALVVIVLYVLVTRFSLKAGVGALLLMVLALGIYQAREELADKVEDEVNNPAKSVSQFQPRYGADELPRASRPATAGGEVA
ncbi:hypothetical protein ABT127_34705 [Streptomyces sp. NPDC001904]|uniref:hypothetical protein n=1 Tax=Streptomyces sp. NPDC001904 TaxID=3154531 RepID=UPI00332F76B1